MRFAIFLALFGLAVANPMSWEYNYQAIVATHDSESPEVIAESTLTATVQATVAANKQQVNIKLSNVKVCEQVDTNHRPVGRTPPGCQEETVHGHWKDQLEKPFSVLLVSNGERLMVPSDDMLWISNLRKGIASTLRIPYVLSVPERQNQGVRIPLAFNKMEETIHGKCLVSYSVSEKPHEQNKYKLVRSVDVSACAEHVVISKTSHGNMTSAGDDQFRGVASRSSVGTFILEGVPSTRLSTYVKTASLEGTVILQSINTVGRSSVAVTNQTLSLTKAVEQELVAKPTDSSLKNEIWSYRAVSDHQRAADSPRWITYNTSNSDKRAPMYDIKNALDIVPADNQQIKTQVEMHITEIVNLLRHTGSFEHANDEIKNTTDIKAVKLMRDVVTLMRMLPGTTQKQIFDDCASKDQLQRLLVLQTMKSSSSAASFSVIINLLKEKKLSKVEIIEIFTPINVGAFDSVMATDLMYWAAENVASMESDVQAAVLINLSTLVRRICIERPMNDFIWPRAMFGVDKCSNDQINAYVQFLKKQLEDYKNQNKQHLIAIYMQAMANVGDEQCMEVLAKWAKNEINAPSPKMFQLHAINGMTKNHLKNSTHDMVRKVLLSVFEAEKYEPEVREAALVSLFTLPQNASMWHRIASNTWREPNLRVARFVNSFIEAIAQSENPHYLHHINAARTARVLTRPFNYSLENDHYYKFSNYMIKPDFGVEFELFAAVKRSTETPEIIKSKLITFFSGLKFPVAHVSMVQRPNTNEWMDSAKVLLSGLIKDEMVRAPAYREALRKLSNVKDIQNIVHTSIAKDAELFMPITGDFIEECLRPETSILAKTFAALKSNQPTETLLYTKMSESHITVPTDVGLPAVINMESNFMVYSKLLAGVDRRTPVTKMAGNFAVRLAATWRTEVQVLVPWKSHKFASGFEIDASLTLPLSQYSVELDVTQPQAKLLKYEIKNQSQKEEQIVVINWIPYVAIKDWTPSVQPRGIYQPIARNPIWYLDFQLIPTAIVNMTARVAGNDVTGRDLDALWSMNIYDLETKEAWQFMINYTPAREGGLAGNFFYASKPESAPYQRINGAQPMIPDLNIHETYQQRMEKLNRSPARKMFSASVEVKNGAQAKKYELVNLWSHERSAPLKKINHQFVAMKSDNMQKKCLCSEVKLPILPRNMSGAEMIRNAIPAILTSQIYDGPCEPSAHAMTFKVNAEMTPERKELVQSAVAWPVYDLVNVELHKMRTEVPSTVEKVIDYSHRYFYPSFKPSTLQSSPTRMVSIQATRSPLSDLMKIKMQSPRQLSSLTGIKVPQMIDTIASVMSQ